MFSIWNDEDYYGPHLVEPLYSTREAAEAALQKLNADYVAGCKKHGVKTIPKDWPHYIQELEVA